MTKAKNKIKKPFKYLGKSDIDKSFAKLKKEAVLTIEPNYDKCCETIKKLKEELLSEYGEYLSVGKGNLVDLTKKYKKSYQVYLEEREEEIRENKYRYSYYNKREPISEEEHIENEFKYNYGVTASRFEKYIQTKEEEQKVLYFSLHKNHYSRSKFRFEFCIYYNFEDTLCIDQLTIKEGRREYISVSDSAKTSPDKIIWLMESFLQSDNRGEELYKKRQIKQEDNRIKKQKVDSLKQKAGTINIKQILDKIDCSYEIDELATKVKIHIILGKGRTTIAIPKRNLKESLQYLTEFVEAIVKADKLKINFRHFQQYYE